MRDNTSNEKIVFGSGASSYFTLDAAASITANASAVTSTVTTGILNISVDSEVDATEAINIYHQTGLNGGAETAAGIRIDMADDSSAAGFVYGLDITASDVTGGSAVYGLNMDSTIERGINHVVGAANKALYIDASNTAQTGGAVVEMGFETATSALSGVSMTIGSKVAGGAAETVDGVKIVLKDGSNTSTDLLRGVHVASAANGTGLQHAYVVSGTGIDAALKADTGYLRVGTGSTPGHALGDDDGFFEGDVEVDGTFYIDGDIEGDGSTSMFGIISGVSDTGHAGVSVAITASGYAFTNTGATGKNDTSLPEASTAIGRWFTFIVTAAQFYHIKPEGSDQILGLTDAAGDEIKSNAAGDSITLMAVDTVNWVVIGSSNMTNSADSWADDD